MADAGYSEADEEKLIEMVRRALKGCHEVTMEMHSPTIQLVTVSEDPVVREGRGPDVFISIHGQRHVDRVYRGPLK